MPPNAEQIVHIAIAEPGGKPKGGLALLLAVSGTKYTAGPGLPGNLW